MENMNKRDNGRELCYSKIIFEEAKVPGYIRDISRGGIKVDIPLQFKLPDKSFSITVIPHESSSIPPFSASGETRWIEEGDIYNTLGISINTISETDEKNYQALISFYSTT